MRRAFDATMIDPAFLADAKKTQLEVTPVNGEKVQVHVAKMLATPERIKELANEATQLKDGVVQATLKWITARARRDHRGQGQGPCHSSSARTGKRSPPIWKAPRSPSPGNEAKGADLKPGSTCDIVYLGDGDVAQTITCP